jgi:hypothetical protein
MMENILVLNRSDIAAGRTVRTNFNRIKLLPEVRLNNPVIDYLITEGGENFYYYLKGLGLADEPNMMVLSSRHSYYYDYNDLKSASTLINLKRLNLMKHLDSFLYTVCNGLSTGSNFIGCFSDWRNQERKDLPSTKYKGCNNFLDSRKEIKIDKDDVSGLLESHWFKVLNMTEIDGLTYFRTGINKKMFN